MIDRYTLPEMGRVWSEAHKFELWCQVESLVLEAQAEAGLVPHDAVEPVKAAPPPTPEAVAEVEAVTDHDVIAFLTAWADNTEPREAAAYVHFGMTSSDLVDTALALQLREATDLLIDKADRADRRAARARARAPAHAAVGRTHGIHAEPDVWGHRVADFAFGMARCTAGCAGPGAPSRSASCPARSAPTRASTRPSRRPCSPGSACARPTSRLRSCSGTGSPNGSARSPSSRRCARRSRLRSGTGSAPRSGSWPRRSASGQKGSSAMPHKRNPVRSERIAGLARVVRAQVVPVLEGIPLWHERDISHSSTERVALPDAAIATDFLLAQTTGLVNGLVVDPARMRANLDVDWRADLLRARYCLRWSKPGCPGKTPTRSCSEAAMATWQSGTPFRETLRAAPASAASDSTRPGWTRSSSRSATWQDLVRSSIAWSS